MFGDVVGFNTWPLVSVVADVPLVYLFFSNLFEKIVIILKSVKPIMTLMYNRLSIK